MALSKEFKEAISNLPSQEKDKIIFRLLKKDLAFTNRLMFELLSEKSIDDKREELKQRLEKKIKHSAERFYSTGYLNMYMRYMSGDINEYVYITKDKYGEIALNIYITIGVLQENKKNILSETPKKARKFCIAVIARVFKILLLLNKQHEDLLLDFKEDLAKIATLIEDNAYLKVTAEEHGLDINWLKNYELPEDLAAYHKNLRAEGYLK